MNPQEPHVHKPGELLEYNYIADGIFVGTNQCCKEGLTELMKKEGIDAHISLEETDFVQPDGTKIFVWLPTPDLTPPTMEQLSFGVAAITKLVAQGKKVYVHSKNGRGRPSTLVMAYFISKEPSIQKALSFIKEKSPKALLQESQMEVLAQYILTQG